MKVTYVGPDEEYGSVDQDGRPIRLAQGESADVSEAKAEQLKRDFPDWFEFEKPKPKPAAKSAKK